MLQQDQERSIRKRKERKGRPSTQVSTLSFIVPLCLLIVRLLYFFLSSLSFLPHFGPYSFSFRYHCFACGFCHSYLFMCVSVCLSLRLCLCLSQSVSLYLCLPLS